LFDGLNMTYDKTLIGFKDLRTILLNCEL